MVTGSSGRSSRRYCSQLTQRRTNSRSHVPSRSMQWAMARSSAASVPGQGESQ